MEILEKVKDSELSEVWDIGINISTSEESIKLAKDYPFIKSFVGIDPEVYIPGSEQFVGFDNLEDWMDEMIKRIRNLILENSDYVKGIGETGLDHYWIRDADEDEKMLSKDLQETLFRKHLELAEELDLPLSIHSRNAEPECLKIIKEYKTYGIFHSYTGDLKTAKGIIDVGWGLGVNGIVTFNNAKNVQDVYIDLLKGKSLVTPEDFYKNGIFFETDSPFLSPEGKRGERNTPLNIKNIYEKFKELINS